MRIRCYNIRSPFTKKHKYNASKKALKELKMSRYTDLIKWIGLDKIAHFSIAMNIAFFTNIWIAIALALVKEIYDEVDYGGFCWKDLLVSVVGALVTLIS